METGEGTNALSTPLAPGAGVEYNGAAMPNVYVFHGDDDLSLAGALAELKGRLGPPDLRDANIAVVSGPETSLEEVQALSTTAPFLAPARLVVVEGLLTTFEERRGRRQRDRGRPQVRALGPWAGLPGVVQAMPLTTLLVFRDGRLKEANPLLKLLKPLATVRSFPTLAGEGLRRWIAQRVQKKGGQITGPALWALADLVGGNLWALEGELEKLCLYAGGRPIAEEDVRLLVSRAREASVFAAVDAMLEGRRTAAVRQVRQLLAEGEEVPHVMAMIARQVRFLLLARELESQGLKEEEMAQRVGASSPFVLRKAREQARRYSRSRLVALHRRLLEADTAIKTGREEKEGALETMVAEVAGLGRE